MGDLGWTRIEDFPLLEPQVQVSEHFQQMRRGCHTVPGPLRLIFRPPLSTSQLSQPLTHSTSAPHTTLTL